jgi:phosphopantothenoylcysteine decarboxylase / phosphopantothenate---cysteine ligase
MKLSGKKILIGITGSIAAYKIPFLVRLLVKEGAEVKIIMTEAAKDFVSPLTLSTLSKNPVLSKLFDNDSWADHVHLGRWADVMLIAPLSCNTLAKMANGLCDNLFLATYLSSVSPVIAVPAMDEDMWKHPSAKRNIETIRQDGCLVIPVSYGELASGLIGEGRMAEPEMIMEFLKDYFKRKDQLRGKKAIVTAGPTQEAIDPVRYISNHSSGKMGFAIAEELAARGAEVTLISGPVNREVRSNRIRLVKTASAQDMFDAAAGLDYDIAVMAAAVADYAPVSKSEEKIKKNSAALSLELKKTQDILATLGERKKKGQVLVGFALETTNETEYAKNKLEGKNADMIVLNSMRDEAAGFGKDTNKVTLFFRDGKERPFTAKSKTDVAKDIVDAIIELV